MLELDNTRHLLEGYSCGIYLGFCFEFSYFDTFMEIQTKAMLLIPFRNLWFSSPVQLSL